MKSAYIESLSWEITEYSYTLKQHSTYTFRMCPHCHSDKMFSKYITEQKADGKIEEETAFGLPKNAEWACETCATVIYEDGTQEIYDQEKNFECPLCGWHVHKEYKMRHGNIGEFNIIYHCCDRCYTKFLVTDGKLPNKQSMNQFEIIKPLKCPRCSEMTLVKEANNYICMHCELKLDFNANKKPILPLYCKQCNEYSVLKRKSFRLEEVDGKLKRIDYMLIECATCHSRYNEDMQLIDYNHKVIEEVEEISSDMILKINSSIDNTLTL